MSRRLKKINQLLKQEVSQLLLREIDFGNILVTVTEVAASPDLKQAKIKITVLPSQKSQQALQIIQRNIFNLQQALNHKLRMKFVPKIRFEIDQVEVKAQQLEKILSKMKQS